MLEVSVYDAKTNLSRYLSLLTDGEEDSIVIKKYSEPIAEIRPYDATGKAYELGIAAGEFAVGEIKDGVV